MIFAGRLSTLLQARAAKASATIQGAMHDLASMLVFLDTHMLAIVKAHAPGDLGLLQGATAAHHATAELLAAWRAEEPKSIWWLMGAPRHFKRHRQELLKQSDHLTKLGLTLFLPLKESVGDWLSQLTHELHEAEIGWDAHPERTQLLEETNTVWGVVDAVVHPTIHDLLTLDSLCHSLQALSQQADALRDRQDKLIGQRSRLNRRIDPRRKKAGTAQQVFAQLPNDSWGDLPGQLQRALDKLGLTEADFQDSMQDCEWSAAERAYAHIVETLESLDTICEAITRLLPNKPVKPRGTNEPATASQRPQEPQPRVAPPQLSTAGQRKPQSPHAAQPVHHKTARPTPAPTPDQPKTVVAALETLQQLGQTVRSLKRQCRTNGWGSVTLDAEDTADFIDSCRELLESGDHSITDEQLAQQLANISEWCATLRQALNDDSY